MTDNKPPTSSPPNEPADQEPVADVRWPDPAGRAGVVWIERNRRFVEVDYKGNVMAIDDLDAAQIAMAAPLDTCDNRDCSQHFPAGFAYCPQCGLELRAPIGEQEQLWSYPGAEGDGLLNTERFDIASVSSPFTDVFRAPEAPRLTLIVAGQPRRLLAIDREGSQVFAFNREKKDWYNYVSHTHFDSEMPKWSWAVLALEKGFALPILGGPATVRLDSIGAGLEVERPKIDSADCIAGPASLNASVLYLCRVGGKPVIVTYDAKTGTWSDTIAVNGAPDINDDMWFAAPVTRNNNLYWAGTSGYVSVRAAPSGLETKWRVWPDGFVPELRIRPIWVMSEASLWQFGATGKQLQFARIAWGGGVTVHPVETTHLTAGECSYTSGMQVYSMPWDEEQRQMAGQGDSFLLPVCGLAGVSAIVADCGFGSANTRVNPAELLEDGATPKPARLRVHRRGSPPVDLGRSPGISGIDQLQAIIFDRTLLIYDSRRNSIDAWTIQ